VVWCCLQDEHILARKFADRWMAQALGVGLFKRRLYRKEVEDTRQVLYTTINPLAKVSNEAPVCIPKDCCCFPGLLQYVVQQRMLTM